MNNSLRAAAAVHELQCMRAHRVGLCMYRIHVRVRGVVRPDHRAAPGRWQRYISSAAGHRSVYTTRSPTLTAEDDTRGLTSGQSEQSLDLDE